MLNITMKKTTSKDIKDLSNLYKNILLQLKNIKIRRGKTTILLLC